MSWEITRTAWRRFRLARRWWRLAKARSRAMGHLVRFIATHPCADPADAAVIYAARQVAELMAERNRQELRNLGAEIPANLRK